jgi:hypothetical protein
MTDVAADDLAIAPDPLAEDRGRELAVLAERMRTTVTPVIGYLELMSEGEISETVAHERWIATIERRMAAMSDLHEQISKACLELRTAGS